MQYLITDYNPAPMERITGTRFSHRKDGYSLLHVPVSPLG
jgi:hypothetical protein